MRFASGRSANGRYRYPGLTGSAVALIKPVWTWCIVHLTKDEVTLIERMESRHGIHTLEHAEAIGIGSQKYNLIRLDV